MLDLIWSSNCSLNCCWSQVSPMAPLFVIALLIEATNLSRGHHILGMIWLCLLMMLWFKNLTMEVHSIEGIVQAMGIFLPKYVHNLPHAIRNLFLGSFLNHLLKWLCLNYNVLMSKWRYLNTAHRSLTYVGRCLSERWVRLIPRHLLIEDHVLLSAGCSWKVIISLRRLHYFSLLRKVVQLALINKLGGIICYERFAQHVFLYETVIVTINQNWNIFLFFYNKVFHIWKNLKWWNLVPLLFLDSLCTNRFAFLIFHKCIVQSETIKWFKLVILIFENFTQTNFLLINSFRYI